MASRVRVGFTLVLGLLLARAMWADETIHFTNATTMTVRAHRVDEGMVTLDLGSNASVTVPIATVDRIEPAGPIKLQRSTGGARPPLISVGVQRRGKGDPTTTPAARNRSSAPSSGRPGLRGGALRVDVSVQAAEAMNNPLSYEWRVTDGTILRTSGRTMTWQLPVGPGLHFAYVLVSNGKGGYTERRLAVSTDNAAASRLHLPPRDFNAPPAPAAVGNSYQSVIRGGGYYTSPVTLSGDGIYVPDATASLGDATGPKTAIVTTDARGYFTIPDVPDGTYDLYCSLEPGLPLEWCEENIVVQGEAVSDPYQGPQLGRGDINGRLLLADETPCGTVNGFFGKTVLGRATLLDAAGGVLAGPYRISEFGHYGFSENASAASVRLECEGAQAVTVPVSYTATTSPRIVLVDSAAPVVTGMSAKSNGSEVGLFLPPPSGLPSDNVAAADFFLTFRGIDTRLSACRYYQAVGAVTSCDPAGNPTGSITFDDWKRKVRMEPFAAAGRRDLVATYINRVDLNLTRNHHSISYRPDRTAAYVCNHLGPSNETQEAADIAIDNAVDGKNLVACVAMDYGVSKGVNGDHPFTRFLIFGPSGQLLLSVNLDGRREKFVPGVCVACHGGDHYAGHFSEAPSGAPGAGSADIGAHFLPYDTGNFVFSSKRGLTESAQEEAIYGLNQNVLQTGPTVAAMELIQGWYASGHQPDKSYVPPSWQGRPASDLQFYGEVYAKSCRTCHVATPEPLNFDHFVNIDTSSPPVYETGRERMYYTMCEGSESFVRNFAMPNSLRTMDLFWSTAGTAVDQPAILGTFVDGVCSLHQSPEP